MKLKMLYNHILNYANDLVSMLKPYCKKIEIAGSIRRRKEICKDIEICAIPESYKLEKFLLEQKHNSKFLFRKNGSRYKQFTYLSTPVDLFLATPENWGWIYLIRTGPKEFNMKLIELLRSMNYISEGGRIYKTGYDPGKIEDRILIETLEEKDIFNLINEPYIEPWNRINF